MKESNGNITVAQRYANALFELSNENLTKEQILSEISDVLTSVDGSEDLKKIITSPAIQDEEKKTVLNEVFSKSNKIILNFLSLLIDKNRFSILPEIVNVYKSELNKINHMLEMKITSAIDLSESEKAMIKVKLEKILNRNLELSWTVDKQLIGGLLYETEGKIIDCSLQHRLEEIRRKVII